jgi:hypothetical protein
MCAMGPEAAVLTARLAEYHAGQLRDGAKAAPRDDPIYVAAAQARLNEFVGTGREVRPRRWARLRRALGRDRTPDCGLLRGIADALPAEGQRPGTLPLLAAPLAPARTRRAP